MRSPQGRLEDILEAIARVERYAARGKEAFERDELIQNWFVRHLQIIGEAVRALPAEVRDRASGVPWQKIIGMRHILVHNYFGIDTRLVWDAVQRDLPVLKGEVEKLLRQLEG
ncbi:MAG: nucleotidyltransferase [Candidatus Tectomicrobia bacterium RIFCSPLOWO2_02_FULL_70_19]|nr:MAG: nucleotidyltransferase [Candidatus Tectomicrobia bacterium RIFCSPLOWO2_02_FULL_70_19]